MDETRKGFFTKEQEKKLDDFIAAEGIYEALDGPAITLTDNLLLQKIKEKLVEKNPEVVEMIESAIDEVFELI